MATLAELLRDPQFRKDVGNNTRDFFQSASNTAASNITAPIDGLAWLLRKTGVPMPQAPLGGSDWAQNAGLMAEPKNKNSLASLLGDAAGNIAPILGYAKAPELAGGLNQLIKNANAPASLNAGWHGQRGAINFPWGDVDQLAKDRAARVAGFEEDYRLNNLHNAVPKDYLPKQYGSPTVTVYRGVPSDIKNAEIRAGDWVALDPKYAKSHGTGNTGKSQVLKMQVPADHVGWAGTDMNEFFYVPR